MKKLVYLATPSNIEGNKEMKDTLGGKGANLQEMLSLQLRVPPAVTLATETCNMYYEAGRTITPELREEFLGCFTVVESDMDLKFGDIENPLLVSVRSGAKFSMPGMMDTILNVGMNDAIVETVAARTNNARFAWDCYRRLIQMYGNVVHEMKTEEGSPFEAILEEIKQTLCITDDTQLSVENLQELVSLYKTCFRRFTGEDFPQDPYAQLFNCIEAVYRSWNGERAILYRTMESIPHNIGTAVNVQAMVFGNMGDTSMTGVGFTRNSNTGENIFFGEYLTNAQGEDVVAGTRTPIPIQQLKKEMPEVYEELLTTGKKLEDHYSDMMDVEFTVQQTILWWLQCRVGKRTGFAAMQIAIDLVREGKITIEEALLRINAEDHLNQVLKPIFDTEEKKKAKAEKRFVVKALNGSPGAATGQVVFFSDDAVEQKKQGNSVVLLRHDTNPDDFKGMVAAEAVVSGKGGATCHALVVARGKGLIAAAGIETLRIDYKNRTATIGTIVIKEGDWISVDGTSGEIFLGKIKTMPSEIQQVLVTKTMKPEESTTYQNFAIIMEWAKERKTLQVKANADNASEASIALAFGAEGIGLYRTEHTIADDASISSYRKAWLCGDKKMRILYLNEMLEYQTKNLAETLEEMDGMPVLMRTVDSPIHEFFPEHHDEKTLSMMAKLAEELGVSVDEVQARVKSLMPVNSNSAMRGCRITIVYPEILVMQITASAQAVHRCIEKGLNPNLGIMIPNAFDAREIVWHRHQVETIIAKYEQDHGVTIPYHFAAMLENVAFGRTLPETVAKAKCKIFSVGSNDYTSDVLFMSREDANSFIPTYLELGILKADPFVEIHPTVDTMLNDSIGKLMSEDEEVEGGVCGEHGGNPPSIIAFHKMGMKSISCSGFRIPIAILGAAQAAILHPKVK